MPQIVFRTALGSPAFKGSSITCTLQGDSTGPSVPPVTLDPCQEQAGLQPGGTVTTHAWGPPLEDLWYLLIEVTRPAAVRPACSLAAGSRCRSGWLWLGATSHTHVCGQAGRQSVSPAGRQAGSQGSKHASK